MRRQKIVVNSRKHDLSIRRTWQCELIGLSEKQIVLVGKFDRDVEHPGLGSIRGGTLSYEFFWFERWYNIFRFHEPDGRLRNYYCNVAMPPAFENAVLDYVDLDIDILVWPDESYEVVDLDDFERNAKTYGYSDEIRKKAESTVTEIIAMINNDNLPASDSFCIK